LKSTTKAPEVTQRGTLHTQLLEQQLPLAHWNCSVETSWDWESDYSNETAVAHAEHSHHHHHRHDSETVEISPNSEATYEPEGHKRRLAEEIAGAYSLGQEIMGHKKHHVTHIVAEVLAVVAALKNTGDHFDKIRWYF
jgi:hypothetical protein